MINFYSLSIRFEKFCEDLNGVKHVAWNVQKLNRVSWKSEKIYRVSWTIFVQITVLFDYLMYWVYLVFLVLRTIKRAPWNREIFNRVYRVCYTPIETLFCWMKVYNYKKTKIVSAAYCLGQFSQSLNCKEL